MKKYFIITLSILLIFLAKGQQLGKETWTDIKHEVKQLVIINEDIQSELENLLFYSTQDTLSSFFKDYKYFNLYVKGNTNSQKLEFWLSNYPYKSKNLIGFFALKEYFIFVNNELPDFLKPTNIKKSFSYREHRIFFTPDSEGVVVNEDDTPCWIFEYKDSLFKMLYNPNIR